MRRLHFLLLILLSTACVPINPIEPEEDLPSEDFKYLSLYVFTMESGYNELNFNKMATATYDIQRWFQTATGGRTFEFLDDNDPFEVLYLEESLEYYQEDWQNHLVGYLMDLGFPVNREGVMTTIWVEGLDSLTSTEYIINNTACEGNCATSLLPIRSVLAGQWVPSDLGVPIHEMGHMMGLEHPVEEADLPLPEEDLPLLSSVMAPASIRTGSSNYEHGFLTTEKEILKNSPFMKYDVLVYQRYWTTNIINHPPVGPEPDPGFSYQLDNSRRVQFSVNAPENHEFYWYFGDGWTSTEREPVHVYDAGTFSVTLLVTSPGNMSARVSQYVQVQ